MKDKIFSKYHLPLLVLIPIVLLVCFFIPSGAVDIQMHDSYYVIGWLHYAAAIGLVLGIKAFLYYRSRGLAFFQVLCWVDILLTIGLVVFLLLGSRSEILGQELSHNAGIFLVLAIASWFMTQIFLAVNYFILLVFAEN